MKSDKILLIEKVKLVGALCGALALGLAIFLIVSQIQTNKLAIEKGCILLNNAIVRGQGEAARKESSTGILIATIMEGASKERQIAFAAAVKREQKRGNPLVVPCDIVADHPDTITAIPIPAQTTTVPK